MTKERLNFEEMRVWIAADLMGSLIRANCILNMNDPHVQIVNAERDAKLALELADALIKELNQGGK